MNLRRTRSNAFFLDRGIQYRKDAYSTVYFHKQPRGVYCVNYFTVSDRIGLFGGIFNNLFSFDRDSLEYLGIFAVDFPNRIDCVSTRLSKFNRKLSCVPLSGKDYPHYISAFKQLNSKAFVNQDPRNSAVFTGALTNKHENKTYQVSFKYFSRNRIDSTLFNFSIRSLST